MGSLAKNYNWEFNLVQFINGELGKPLEWGRRDCATLALNCLRTMVGAFEMPWPQAQDPESPDRICLAYDTEEGARKFTATYISVSDFLRSHGATEVKPRFEQRGDFLFAQNEGFEACHVILGTHAANVTRDGVVLVPLRALRLGTEFKVLRI